MRFDRMFFEARIDPEEKKRLLDEIVFLDKNTDPSVFENICNKAKREFKGLIYPDGKVAVWNKSGWTGEEHWEHVAVSERIHAAGVEKVKPLAAIYINTPEDEDPFVTFSSSNNSYFYPKYLRHHGDNNASKKQSDIMFNALPTIDRILYDNREVSRDEWEDENVSSNQLDIPFENNKPKIRYRTVSGPQTSNTGQR